MLKKLKHTNQGFTLIELMVVIIILGTELPFEFADPEQVLPGFAGITIRGLRFIIIVFYRQHYCRMDQEYTQ